jgi:hypothetical protein
MDQAVATPVMLPNFCIIGAMRSGTTSLARYLGAHPDIFMAQTKEVRYFDRYFEQGLEWYRSQFRGARSERAIGEATPYMHDRASMRRMAAALPDLRLIAIVRNPVDRAYSHYWMRRAHGHETAEFADAVSPELHGSTEVDAPAARYLRWGRYLEQLTRVFEFYPPERLHVVILEELQAAPPDHYGEVCRFLGVDDTFVPPNLGRVVNQHVTFRSRKVRKLTRRLPRLAGRAVGRVNSVRGSYPPMDPALRAELLRYFELANAALSSWLGKDLSVWTT